MMVPDWIKELIKSTGVQVPGMVILALLMYFILAGPVRDSTEQNKKSTEMLGETRGTMQWCARVLGRIDAEGKFKP